MQKKWTEENIKTKILEVVKAYGLERMPSRAETDGYYGNTALSNCVSKTGGFYHWANKLDLEIKKSESLFGITCEQAVANKLIDKGYECKLTGVTFPYDILVNGCVKVDVKAAHKTIIDGYEAYSFRLNKEMQTCDLYIAVCCDESDEIIKNYVIPSHVLTGHKQICMSTSSTIYDKFLERWEIIDDFSNAMLAIS